MSEGADSMWIAADFLEQGDHRRQPGAWTQDPDLGHRRDHGGRIRSSSASAMASIPGSDRRIHASTWRRFRLEEGLHFLLRLRGFPLAIFPFPAGDFDALRLQDAPAASSAVASRPLAASSASRTIRSASRSAR